VLKQKITVTFLAAEPAPYLSDSLLGHASLAQGITDALYLLLIESGGRQTRLGGGVASRGLVIIS
jgi:hypothetical protein